MEIFKQVFATGFILLIVFMYGIRCDEDLSVIETESTESTITGTVTESIITTITEITTFLTTSFIEIATDTDADTEGTVNDTEETANDTECTMSEDQTKSTRIQDQFYDDNESNSLIKFPNEQDDGLLPPIGGDDTSSIPKIYTDPITFRKCCAKAESFDLRLKCINKKSILDKLFLKEEEKEKNDIIGKKYPWFPSHIISEVSPIENVTPDRLNLTRVKVRYASRPKCHESERLILQWYKEDSPFFFILISNGSMVELDNRNMRTVASWPVDSYCLESVPSKYSYHVAILCPCMHSVCIRKCCPRGFYYNTSVNICSQFKGPSRAEYTPKFYEGHNKSKKKVNYYLLRKTPRCTEKKVETLSASERQGSQLYIQRDGSIHVTTIKWHRINNSRYCADIFIDKRGKETTNILYCMRNVTRRTRKIFTENKMHKKNPIRNKDNRSILNMNFYLFICIVIFIIIE